MIGEDSFRTLKDVEVIPNPNYPAEPWFSTGGLAIVFKIKVKEKVYALKCFYTEANERQERLGYISSYLKQHSSPYFVDFTYLDDELWVETAHGGGGYPVVLMEWIEGKTLDNYLEGVCKHNDKVALKNLYFQFCNLAWWLQQQPIAHGDLKHDNLIVTPEGKLKLIDYDGMFVPALVGRKANELGSPCYQHPQRDTYFFNKDLDDFSLLILQITLLALQHEPSLFAKHYNGDGILLKDTDYRNFSGSSIKTTLWQLPEVKLPLLLSQVQANLSQLKAIDLMPLIQNVEWINWLIVRDEKDKLKLGNKTNQSSSEGQILKNLVLNDRRWRNLFIKQISHNYSLRENLIDKYKDIWDWDGLSMNPKIPCTLEVIEKYKNKWVWKELSKKVGLPWTIELIENCKDRWDWKEISKKNDLSWNLELIEKYRDKWDWKEMSNKNDLQWSISLIEKYEDKWDYYDLGSNSGIPWTPDLIKKYKHKSIWNGLSKNSCIPWTMSLIEEYEDKWHWGYLGSNSGLPWTLNLIGKFKYKWWNWYGLSRNTCIPWSISLIQEFKDKWEWKELSENTSIPWTAELIEKFKNKWNWSMLSKNASIPWTAELIEKFKDKWEWWKLSENTHISWSVELIEKFNDQWYWRGLSTNTSIPWTVELIEKFKDKWSWKILSYNSGLPWGLEFIEEYNDKWDWPLLCKNPDLSWSISLIDKYEDKLDWESLNKNYGVLWTINLIEKYEGKWDWFKWNRDKGFFEKIFQPLLNDELIDEIMAEI